MSACHFHGKLFKQSPLLISKVARHDLNDAHVGLIQPLRNAHQEETSQFVKTFFFEKKLRWFISEASVLGVDSASSSWGILEMSKDDVFVP